MHTFSQFLAEKHLDESFDRPLELKFDKSITNMLKADPNLGHPAAYELKVGDQNQMHIVEFLNKKRNAVELHLNNMEHLPTHQNDKISDVMKSGHHSTVRLYATIAALALKHLTKGRTIRLQSNHPDQYAMYSRIAAHLQKKHPEYEIQHAGVEEAASGPRMETMYIRRKLTEAKNTSILEALKKKLLLK